MRYATTWAKFPLTHGEVKNYFHKYGHLLKWKNYKENILEIGCASGRITRDVLYPHVENHVGKLLAIDKSEEMINFAKAQHGKQNIEYRIMDVMDKDEKQNLNSQFDHIFSFYCAHWIVDQRTLFHNIYKMLKPKGQLFMTVFLDTAIKQSFLKQEEEGKWFKYLPQERIFPDYTNKPIQYITNLAEAVGFEVDACESEKKSSVVEDLEDVVPAVVSIYKHLDILPPKLKEEYMQEHIQNTASFCTHLRSNKYDFPYETMICVCSKNM